LAHTLADHPAATEGQGRQQQERHRRQAGHQAKDGQRATGEVERLALTEDLDRERLPEVQVAAAARHHEAGRGRDQQRWDLADQAVAHGEDREATERLAGGHAE
ncbi:hypothetical protein RZS08_56900, partial [Arthrospira platensis SPKY1]|nr:hypothetical protein [Arthrospira platensis SPKY1]